MFGLFESSRALGQPLELYLFQIGNDFYRFCNGEKDFSYAGQTYAAVPIKRTAISSSGALDKQTLTVSVGPDNLLAVRLRGAVLSSVVTLILRQGHRDDPDKQFLVAWVGRVLDVGGNPDDGSRSLTCQPASTSLKRIGLRRNWQYGCPHVLYGDQCRASIAAASVQVTPTARQGRSVSLASGWNAQPVEKYNGGLAMWDGNVRTIVRANTTDIQLGAQATFDIGTVLTLALGCDHLRDDCSTIHTPVDEADYGGGNIRNFGGQPFIPTTNPVGYVSNYS